MPKRTNAFQQLVYLIQEQLKDRSDTRVSECKMLRDRISGEETEVDIVVESVVHGVPFVLSFECRESNRRPTKPWVQLQVKRHKTLSNKLVLVANRTFSKTALACAQREGAEAVELSEAAKMDWPAQIDEYTNMLFAAFDFKVRYPECSVEYFVEPGQPPFSNDELVVVKNEHGQCAPLTEALDAVVRSYESFAKPAMDVWYKLPKEQRRGEHTITYEYIPPAPMSVAQGVLAYQLKKLAVVVSMKVGEVPMNMAQLGYRDTRVAHGEATMLSGGLAGQTVRFVMTEQRGQQPRAALMLSGTNGTERASVRTAQLDPNGPVRMCVVEPGSS